MNKEDLKNGSVVELRNGDHCIKIDNILLRTEMVSFYHLSDYDDNLRLKNRNHYRYDIMKVDSNVGNEGDLAIAKALAGMSEWTWKREPEPNPVVLTDQEKTFLKMLDPKWKWIIFLKNGILLLENKPVKEKNSWETGSGDNSLIYGGTFKKNIFNLNALNGEPYNIKELLQDE